MILDGKKIRNEILDEIKKEIDDNKLNLTLAIIYVGDDPASKLYVNNKIKYCAYVGIKTILFDMPNETKEEEIINKINELNNDENITGIILQSPVPNGIDIENCIKHIKENKDIDGFTKESFYKLAHNLPGLRPCTAKGIVELLNKYNISLEGKNAVIIGRGNLVGKPLLFELINNDVTVTICHRKTKDLEKITRNADIIICAAGHAKLLTSDMVSENCVVIDVGISIIDGKIVGDVDYENVKDKCAYITPNPGGVGPMTIAMIIKNILQAGKKQ